MRNGLGLKKPKYTKREKHLLMVIANLRGSACDAWARLNFILVRRPDSMSLKRALTMHTQLDELKDGEDQLQTPLMGAGLPWHAPHALPPDVALAQEKVLDKRAKWSENKLVESGRPKRWKR